MTAHDENFCRGIAMVLQGESLKASSYVTHNLSLGVLREKMVASFVRQQTPARFGVETGLIRDHDSGQTSPQCDLLIHDQASFAPLYRWDDFVVVHARAARAVVEVKSTLDQRCFGELLELAAGVLPIGRPRNRVRPIPTFCYALDGVSFNTAVKYVCDAMAANRVGVELPERALNLPVAMAVQDQGILSIRPTATIQDVPLHVCILNLRNTSGQHGPSGAGIETGLFLEFYRVMLKEEFNDITAPELYQWFNAMELPDAHKAWVSSDGQLHSGRIPW